MWARPSPFACGGRSAGGAERFGVGPGEGDIMGDAFALGRGFVRAKLADELGRAACPELAGGDALAWGEHRSGREHGVALDLAAVHDDRAEADEGAVVEEAAVDHREMADQNLLADQRR